MTISERHLVLYIGLIRLTRALRIRRLLGNNGGDVPSRLKSLEEGLKVWGARKQRTNERQMKFLNRCLEELNSLAPDSETIEVVCLKDSSGNRLYHEDMVAIARDYLINLFGLHCE
ncbi:hypothetical protein GOBAR_DD17566 [Gossypium barbadense]|nr:hypothetical protein GOBAR_DD17566 [Gossypium barbadense]